MHNKLTSFQFRLKRVIQLSKVIHISSAFETAAVERASSSLFTPTGRQNIRASKRVVVAVSNRDDSSEASCSLLGSRAKLEFFVLAALF